MVFIAIKIFILLFFLWNLFLLSWLFYFIRNIVLLQIYHSPIPSAVSLLLPHSAEL
jgi:hypothetical protein